MIEVRDLHKSYGDFEALRGVSFDVKQGEIIGLLGPNGAGKSTAMRIITGYLSPTSGSVRVMGQEVIEDPIAAQKHIGYLPEGNPLYLDLRLIESLRFAAEMQGLRGGDRDDAIRDAIRSAGLEGKERQRIVTFSRGYRQRVGLAKALLHRPSILILDEPSSGLDPNQQREMRRFIRSLGERCAVIFSTHILPEVSAVCDRVIVINKGELAAEGSVDSIYEQARLAPQVACTISQGADAAVQAWAGLDMVQDAHLDGARLVASLRETPADPSGLLGRLAQSLHSAGVVAWGLDVQPRPLEEAFAALTGGEIAAPREEAPGQEAPGQEAPGQEAPGQEAQGEGVSS